MGYVAIAVGGGRLDHQPVDRVQLAGPAHGHRLDTSRSQRMQVLGRIALQREYPDDRGHGRMPIGCGRLAVFYQPRPA